MDQDILIKYVDGNASQQEREQVLLWVKADSANMKELVALRRLHDLSIWNGQKGATATVSGTGRRQIYRIVSVVAVFALLLGISISHFLEITPDVLMQTINVPPGQRVQVLLSDGSSVWLNAGSSFSFPSVFSNKSRDVRLDGEGYFEVKKDSKKPFIVKTPAYEVKVLGTTFNLMAYSRSRLFEVSLISGSVDVFSPSSDEVVHLEPDTRAYLAGNRLMKGEIRQHDRFLWKDGLICFDDEPFEKMMDMLKLYFDIEIIVENPSRFTGKYTGKFRTKDGIEHILRVMQRTEPISYEKDANKNEIRIR